MGNSIYGNVCQGISNKKKFDVKTGKIKKRKKQEIKRIHIT